MFLFNTCAGLTGDFAKSCLEQLFTRASVSACFCKKELPNKCFIRNFPETPETCILYACKLLKRNYMTELFILYACKLLKNNSMTALFILYACNSITPELFIGISKIFKKPLGNLVRSFFLVALQPVCCKPATLFKISSRATSRKIECTREKL